MPIMETRLRDTTPDDLPVLGALATQVFFDTYATDGLRPALVREAAEAFDTAALGALLARPEGGLVVAERQGHLLGFVQFARHPLGAALDVVATADGRAALEIERLYVLPRFQGQGLGRALMAHAAGQARAAQCPLLWLTAWVGNLRARAWYAHHGWRDIGATDHVFEGQRFENRVLVKDA